VLADDARVAAEVAPPEVVAEDCDVVAPRLFVFDVERAAVQRGDAERAEEVCGGARGLHAFGAAQARQVKARGRAGRVERERVEAVRARFEVCEVRVGDADLRDA
jgi:hypothetical protein